MGRNRKINVRHIKKVCSWDEESKRKEIADAIGCDEDEVVMFKCCGVVGHSVYSRV